jgi:hypothetical protein
VCVCVCESGAPGETYDGNMATLSKNENVKKTLFFSSIFEALGANKCTMLGHSGFMLSSNVRIDSSLKNDHTTTLPPQTFERDGGFPNPLYKSI